MDKATVHAPDHLVCLPREESCTVLAGRTLSNNGVLCELVLQAPYCATQVQPGQFVHLQLPQLEAHILRRPFSVYKASAKEGTITLFYQVVGEGTQHMSTLEAGAKLSVIGPLGRGWQPLSAQHCLLIGGGVGAAPLYLLACKLASQRVQLDVVLGAACADYLCAEDSFVELLSSKHVHITTDDGSKGYKGFTTQIAAELLAHHHFDYLATCGPEPMQKVVAELAKQAGITCEVSLERRMACGVGACLSCVIATEQGKKRACVDGPVFPAQEVCW